MLIQKLQAMKARYEELMVEASQPDAAQDAAAIRARMQEMARLEPLSNACDALSALESAEEAAIQLKAIPEMRELAEEELQELKRQREALQDEIRLMLLPKDENDDKNVIVELRAGAGGDEAALFAALLLRMYLRYAERRGFGAKLLAVSGNDLGGVKEASLLIEGRGAFSLLKFESGVHRIQRVPQTESSGRIHTSTATVAVLPELDDVEVEINPNDLRVDVYRSSGHGGQCVNTTDSAVRITHLPSGLVVTCQNEKSQIKNREQAMKVLKSRLYEQMLSDRDREYAGRRREQVGTGERNERIRTYNFPQGRVTDHRINLTLYQIEDICDGGLDPVISALQMDHQQKLLLNAEKD